MASSIVTFGLAKKKSHQLHEMQLTQKGREKKGGNIIKKKKKKEKRKKNRLFCSSSREKEEKRERQCNKKQAESYNIIYVLL